MKVISFSKTSQITLLVIILMISTKFFQSTPFETLFFQLHAITLVVILFFLLLYISHIILVKKYFNKAILYFLLLILFMPVYSAYRSHVEFGQPYLYALLSERGWLILGVGIWLFYMITTKKIALSTLEFSFLLLSWGSLLIFSLVVVTFDPTQLTGDENFARITQGRGLRFKFVKTFITFGSLYYFIRYSIYKKPFDLIILLTFLCYVLFIIQGRLYMIFLAGIFLLYYYNNHSFSQFTIIIMKTALFFLGALVLIRIFMPDYFNTMKDMFVQMFIVLGGEVSSDASANARIFASMIVLDHFDTHPLSIWLGTGKLSNQWNGGYTTLYGHFHPGDIGLLGGMFLYGALGILILMIIPLLWQVKEIRKVKKSENVFIVTVKYMVILSIIHLPLGGLYLGANSMMFFFILLANNILNKSQNAR